ncbi:MAG: FAD-dependent oxidoreductase [Hoeflea sp.]|uniref:NAD(P)/FAD-dependent oxidoreductase n=1 Tax=Hoeflea sp. TaxID=1940281 RepID=UPI000C0DA9CD|nr:FAD-dependent oxidoreductase [Hoeflea sp.]PHR24137.1 MAG: FAD-dependent oxidoreductase [Hoeflea sp.]
MIETDILVIGAGLGGLTLARELSSHSGKVVVIEKSRSAGGRLSTRRADAGSFDHGAQYLTNRTAGFSGLLDELSRNADLAAWDPVGKDSAHTWWVGQPGMSAIGKSLAKGLDITYRTRAKSISRQDEKFIVRTEAAEGDGPVYRASRVVAAMPSPQALDLLEPLDPVFAQLRNVSMAPCWSAMLAFDGPPAQVPDLIRGQDGDTLALIARNGSKPNRTGETFVLHATPQWSRKHLEAGRDTVKAAMLEAMRRQTGFGQDLPEPIHCEVHRWLYALVEKPLDQPFLGNAQNTLFACGDWCIGGRAEVAHQSGEALAHHIISL